MTIKIPKNLKRCTPVFIEWVDIIGDCTWEDNDSDLDCPVLLAVGFYISHDDKQVVIAMNIAQKVDDEEVSGRQAIPLGAINDFYRVRLKKVGK